MSARTEQLHLTPKIFHDDAPSDRDFLEATAVKGIGAYQAALETLGVSDDLLSRADELLQGDHVFDGKIVLGRSHAKAIDIGRDVLTGVIAMELEADVILSNDEVMAVGELFMFAHRNEREEQPSKKTLKREQKGVKKAMNLIEQNPTLHAYVKLHPDCFHLAR